jgi:MOSC domain-containing protein YiiM
MGVVLAGGDIQTGDEIAVRYPAGKHTPMQRI